MTREKMRAIQSAPRRPVRRIHSCTCRRPPDPRTKDPGTTGPLVRGPKPGTYRCSNCGREA
jgi:hypothetical protein